MSKVNKSTSRANSGTESDSNRSQPRLQSRPRFITPSGTQSDHPVQGHAPLAASEVSHSDSEVLNLHPHGTLTRSAASRSNILPVAPIGSPGSTVGLHGNTVRARTKSLQSQPERGNHQPDTTNEDMVLPLGRNTTNEDRALPLGRSTPNEDIDIPLGQADIGDMDYPLEHTNDMDTTFSEHPDAVAITSVSSTIAPSIPPHTLGSDGQLDDLNTPSTTTNTLQPPLVNTQHQQTSGTISGTDVLPNHHKPKKGTRGHSSSKVFPADGDADPSSDSSDPSRLSNQSNRSFKDPFKDPMQLLIGLLQKQQDDNLKAQRELQETFKEQMKEQRDALLAVINQTDKRVLDQVAKNAAKTEQMITAAVDNQFQKYRILMDRQGEQPRQLPPSQPTTFGPSSAVQASPIASDDDSVGSSANQPSTQRVAHTNNSSGIIASGANKITVYGPLSTTPPPSVNQPTSSSSSSSSSSSTSSSSMSSSAVPALTAIPQAPKAIDATTVAPAATIALQTAAQATPANRSYAAIAASTGAIQMTVQPTVTHTATIATVSKPSGTANRSIPASSKPQSLHQPTIDHHFTTNVDQNRTNQLRSVLQRPNPPTLSTTNTIGEPLDFELNTQSSSDTLGQVPNRIFHQPGTVHQPIYVDSPDKVGSDSESSFHSSQLPSDYPPSQSEPEYNVWESDDDVGTGDIRINVNDPRLRGPHAYRTVPLTPQPTRDISYFSESIQSTLKSILSSLVDYSTYSVAEQETDIYYMIPSSTEYPSWERHLHFLKANKRRMEAMHNYLTKMPLGTAYPPPAMKIFVDPLMTSWFEVGQSRIPGAGQGLFLRHTNTLTGESSGKLSHISFPYYGTTSAKDTYPGYAFKVRNGLYIIPDRIDRPLTSFINDDIHISAPDPRRTNMYFPATHHGEIRNVENVKIPAGAELTVYFGENYSFLTLKFHLAHLLLVELEGLLDNPARHDWKRWRDAESWDSRELKRLLNHIQTIPQLYSILDSHSIQDARTQVLTLVTKQKYPVPSTMTHAKLVAHLMLLWSVVRSEYHAPQDARIKAQFPHMFLSQPRFISHFIPGLYGHLGYAQYDRTQFMKVFEQLFNGPRRGTLEKLTSFTNSPYNAWRRADYAERHHGQARDFSQSWCTELGLQSQEETMLETTSDPTSQSMHPLSTMRGKKPSVERGSFNRVMFKSTLNTGKSTSPTASTITSTSDRDIEYESDLATAISNSKRDETSDGALPEDYDRLESLIKENPVLEILHDRMRAAMNTTEGDLETAINRFDAYRNHWLALPWSQRDQLVTRFKNDPVYNILTEQVRNATSDGRLDSAITQFIGRCNQAFSQSSSSSSTSATLSGQHSSHQLTTANANTANPQLTPTYYQSQPPSSSSSSSSYSALPTNSQPQQRHRSPSPSEVRSTSQFRSNSPLTIVSDSSTVKTARQVERERDTDDYYIVDVNTAPYPLGSWDPKAKTQFTQAILERKDTSPYVYRGRPKEGDPAPFPIEDFINHYYEIAERSNTHPKQLINAILSPTAMYHPTFAPQYRVWKNNYPTDPAFSTLPPESNLSAYWERYREVCIFLCRREREIVPEHTVLTNIGNLRLAEPTGVALRTLWAAIRLHARKLRKERQPDFYAVLETALFNSPFQSNPEDITVTNIENRYKAIIEKQPQITVPEALELVVVQLEDKSISRLAKIKAAQVANTRAPPAPTPIRQRANVAFTDHQYQTMDLVVHAAPVTQHQASTQQQQLQHQSNQPQQNYSQPYQQDQPPKVQSSNHQQNSSNHQQNWTPVSRGWNRNSNNHNNQLLQQSSSNSCYICGYEPASEQHCGANCPHRIPNVSMLDIADLARRAVNDPSYARNILERALSVAKLSKVSEERKKDIRNTFERWINEWRANSQPSPNDQQTQLVTSTINRYNQRNGNGPQHQQSARSPQSMQLVSSNTVQLIQHQQTIDTVMAMKGLIWELNTEHKPTWQSIVQQQAAPDLSNRNLVFIMMRFRAAQQCDTRFSESTKECLPVDPTTQTTVRTALAAMIDNGSSINLCTAEFVRDSGALVNWIPDVGIMGVTGASCAGQVATFVIELEGQDVEGRTVSREVLVSALVIEMASKLILGGQFLADHNVICYPDQRLASFFRTDDRIFIQYLPVAEMQQQLQEDQQRLRGNVAAVKPPNQLDSIQQILRGEPINLQCPSSTPVTANTRELPPTITQSDDQPQADTTYHQQPVLATVATMGNSHHVTCEDVLSDDESEEFIDSPNLTSANTGVVASSTVDGHTSLDINPTDSHDHRPSGNPILPEPVEYPVEPCEGEPATPTPHSIEFAIGLNDTTAIADAIEEQEYRDYVRRHCTQSLPELRPELFPENLWEFVPDAQKPLVKTRWDPYPEARLLECIQIIYSIKVCEETETRREQAPMIRAFLFANIDTICFVDPMNPPCIPGFEADIILKPSATVYFCKSRPKQIMERASEDARCNWMMAIGKMEPSKSPWDHPTLLVPNRERISAFLTKHGANAMKALYAKENSEEVIALFRLVMDFRELNLRTVLERFPLPRISDLLDKCTNRSNRYSGGDIADAYFCVLLREAARQYTAFSTATNHLQYRVMPQGLHSAPAMFARLIHKMFGDVVSPELLNYFDDIIVTAKTLQDHMDLWQRVMDILRTHKLTLKPSKTSFNFYQQKVLGHILCANGRSLDPERVKAIQNWKRPENLTELQSIIGTSTFAQPYIQNLSQILEPLHELNTKGIIINDVWDDSIHGRALDEVKRALTNAPVLLIPDPNQPYRVHVDACKTGRGLGAVLLQKDPTKINADGSDVWGPCCYWSRILTQSERKLASVELELTAMHDCIRVWYPYLYHTLTPFEVIVDCYALVYLVLKMNNSVHSNHRLTRYCLNLQDYYFSVTHRKGKEHIDADALSRLFQVDDMPVVNDENTLRHDSGPLTDADIQQLRRRFDRDADIIISTIRRHQTEQLDSLQLRVATARIWTTTKQSGSPDMDTVRAFTTQCSTTALNHCCECNHKYSSNIKVIGHVQSLVGTRHNPTIKLGASAKALEKQLHKDVQWDSPNMQRLRVRILKAIVVTGICAHPLRMKHHNTDLYNDCRTGQCNCITNALKRHYSANPICQRTLRSLQSRTLKEIIKNQFVLAVSPDSAQRITHELQHRLEVEHRRFINNWETENQQQPEIEATQQLEIDSTSSDDSAKDDEGREQSDPISKLRGVNKTRALKRHQRISRINQLNINYWATPPPILAYAGIVVKDSLITNTGLVGSPNPNDINRQRNPPMSDMSIHHQPTIQLESTNPPTERIVTRQSTGNSRPSAIAVEQSHDKIVRSAQKTERDIERNDQLISEYNYLHGLHYKVSDDDGTEYQVIDTFVASKSKTTGRVFKSIAWPTNAVTCAQQRDSANWDIRDCNGEQGTIELVKAYQSSSDQHWRTTMPINATGWLEHQRNDPDVKQQLDECDHFTTRLYLNNSQATDPHPTYLYRPQLTNGQLGPLMRRFSITEENQHGNIQHTMVRTYDQFVVPKAMRRTVLYHLHDQMGHPGSQRCLASIRRNYWWPSMSAEVKLYTHQCRFCEIRKANNIRPKVPIQSYRTPLHPFHLTHIDLTGPLSNSHGYEYILVCKDALTKYTIIRKLPNKSMSVVIPALVDIFNEYGAPRELVSDRGTEFTNISLKNVCRLLQVHKIFCTPGNPRSNGLAENAMRTLKDMLAYYVDKTQTNWLTYISVIQHIYNTTINLSTGYTPFYLLFGRECPSPDEDQLKKPLRELPEFKDLKIDDYVKGLRDSLALAWDALGATFWTDKTEIYNSAPKKRLPFKEYKIDQLVYIKRIPKRFYKDPVDELNYHLSSKLQERFSGPYRITEQLSPVLYKAMIHGTERVIHAINMKPARFQLDVVDDQFENDDDTWQQVQQFNQLDYDQIRAHYCQIHEN